MISNGRVAYLVNIIAVRSEQGFWDHKCLYIEGVIIRNLKRPSFQYLQKTMIPLQWHEKSSQDPVIKFTGFPNLTSRRIWHSGVGKVRGRPWPPIRTKGDQALFFYTKPIRNRGYPS